MSELETIKIGNEAAALIPEKRVMHRMYEDSDLDGREDAEELCAWIDQYASGQFVFVSTGDFVQADCSRINWNGQRGHDCDTYDADYHLYMVPVSAWNDCKDQVMKADRRWREEAKHCRRYPDLQVSLVKLQEMVAQASEVRRLYGHCETLVTYKTKEVEIFADGLLSQVYPLDESGVDRAIADLRTIRK